MIIDNFLGRPVEYWAHLDSVLRKHNVKSTSQLDELLEKKEKRVEVYDAINLDRQLGTLPKPDMGAPYVRMPVYEPARMYPMNGMPPASINITTVDFTANIKRGPNPLDVRGVLTTHTSLKHLMKVRDFRLPGETADQAERRRYY